VFLHGWAGTGGYFDQTVEHLDLAALRLITFDMRGHGDSERPDTELTLERLAGDVLAVADEARAQTFVAIGFSMGGKFAQYLPLRAADRVEALVLVAGVPAAPLPLPQEMVAEWNAMAGDAAAFATFLRPFMHKQVPEEILRRFGEQAAQIPRADLERTLELFMSSSFLERLRSVRVPVLVVAGAYDPLVTAELNDAIVGSIPNARLQQLDCGHEVPIEQPDELAGLIEGFVSELN
jgi:pimeloyl-ACP methyl ester carboxylesterase